jgi:hypothetical protein
VDCTRSGYCAAGAYYTGTRGITHGIVATLRSR